MSSSSVTTVASFSLSTSKTSFSSLSDFLRERKEQVLHHSPAESSSRLPLSLVIGNPAGDADSILSALCWAYVMDCCATTTTTSAVTSLTVPILSISLHDLTTQRPETMLLLEWAGVVAPDTACLIDINDTLRHRALAKARVTLVDHNRLDTALAESHPDWTVTAILDHHYDEGLYTDAWLREIAFENDRATVASTTTLITERWLQAKQMQHPELQSPLDSDVALLLLGTILLDSVNMSPAAGKGTPRDQAALDALLLQTNWRDGKITRRESDDTTLWDPDTGRPHPTRLFERLQQAKFDVKFWKGLSVRDALRLDYKQFTPNGSSNNQPFGASTVLLDWDTFLTKGDVLSGIEMYMQEANVSFLAIMCTFTDADSHALQRQLILCAAPKSNPSLLDSMTEYLQNLDDESNLQLEERSQSDVSTKTLHLRVFDQGKAKASRKQVAPLLIRYFETCTE